MIPRVYLASLVMSAIVFAVDAPPEAGAAAVAGGVMFDTLVTRHSREMAIYDLSHDMDDVPPHVMARSKALMVQLVAALIGAGVVVASAYAAPAAKSWLALSALLINALAGSCLTFVAVREPSFTVRDMLGKLSTVEAEFPLPRLSPSNRAILSGFTRLFSAFLAIVPLTWLAWVINRDELDPVVAFAVLFSRCSFRSAWACWHRLCCYSAGRRDSGKVR